MYSHRSLIRGTSKLPPLLLILGVLLILGSHSNRLAYHEIAAELQVPLGTVRSRISRARKRLRAELLEYAQSCGFAERELSAA